ncbi:MAG: histidinol-phosphatase HisJ family protein [Desulfosarcina sp.]|nr:histidinol-phosphatase HisJ family protein [Desulfosarcina sp.]
MIDYHVHTSLCNHATGTMEQYVRAAVAKRLSTICFLDHLTFQEAGRHNAMFPREVPMYVNSARRLARQYREKITVRVGLEIDFSPRHVDRCIDIVNTFDLDVVGSSIHFLDGEDVVTRQSAWGRGEISADVVYPKYLRVLESMLDYDYFNVVCHLDLPKKYNKRPSPPVVKGFLNLLEKIRENDLLGRCAQLQIPVVTGSDAHSPESVGRDLDKARDLLETAGYQHLTGFSHRRRETLLL